MLGSIFLIMGYDSIYLWNDLVKKKVSSLFNISKNRKSIDFDFIFEFLLPKLSFLF